MSKARSEQKRATHADILRSAQHLLRTKGIAGTSVAEVMKGAGLTVGGFYAHFESKDALIESVLRRTLGEMRAKLVGGLEEADEIPRLEQALQRYLSKAHRDRPAHGCPLPSSLGELSQADTRLKSALADEIEEHLRALAGPELRTVALGLFALMVGGLSLSRALKGTALSQAVLDACIDLGRAALRQLARKPD